MTPERKRALLAVPLDYLARALRLPEHVYVDHALQDDAARFGNHVKLILSGAGLPDECLTAGRPIPVVLQFVQVGDEDQPYLEPRDPALHPEPRPPV